MLTTELVTLRPNEPKLLVKEINLLGVKRTCSGVKNKKNVQFWKWGLPNMSTFLQVTSVLAARETDLAVFRRIFCCLLGFLTSGIWQPKL